MSKIGLIAGQGALPCMWARRAQKKGHQVYAFPVIEEKTRPLTKYTAETKNINLGALEKLLQDLAEKDIKKIIMLGKVEKSRLFANFQPDMRMKSLLGSLPNLSDDLILKSLLDHFAKQGFEILKQTMFMEDLIPQPGILTEKMPAPELKEEMDFGLEMAQKIGDLGIGQTVVVKQKAVLAVEAIEGTDSAVMRGGKLGGEDCVVAKVSRSDQDFRFDTPTVGLETLKMLEKVKASGLVLEAGKTFIVDYGEFIKQADQAGLVVAARKLSN
ncbi:MAG: LpxI family protein [Bacillota bacterium]